MYANLTQQTDADIIIIGAGISGMSAAFYINNYEPSLNILVLEASSRIGGRTLTMPLNVQGNQIRSFDVGGQFVNIYQRHIMDVLQKLELRLCYAEKNSGNTIWDLEPDKVEGTLKGGQFFDFAHLPGRIELIKFSEKIKRMSEYVTFNTPHSIPDSQKLDFMTMETFITENLILYSSQNYVRHIIRITIGIEPSQLTVLFYLAFCNATGGVMDEFFTDPSKTKQTWIKGGADQICHKIAGIIGRQFVKTNKAVKEIIRDSDCVTIKTENDVYVCSYAIVAIPPKEILDIKFNPALQKDRKNLLHSLDEGHLIKFVVTYETAFWKEKGFTGNIISSGKCDRKGPIQACYDISEKSSPALTGYITSIDCLQQPDETYKTEVLQQLAKYFGEEALNPLAYYEKSWLTEPYIYHCIVNSPGIGNMAQYHEIKRPVGRLFWAGTETATCWNGYMSGAVQSGYRAALEVLYDFRPQMLTARDIAFIFPRPRQRSTALTDRIVNYGTNWRTYLTITGFVLALFYFRPRNKS